jgi:hypothetical protein
MHDEDARTDDLDLGGGDGEAAAPPGDDPLAGVEPEATIEDVSDGPEEERLGGEGAAIGEEPAPGEFMEEPEEPEEPAATEEPAAVAEEPQAEPEKPKPAGKKPKTPPREYEVLRIAGEEISSPLDKPIKARNGDDAIKEAYKALAESSEESMTLVAIPTGYFKPKEVKGKKREDYAVEVK